MKLLAIDGSTSVAGIAIFNHEGELELLTYYRHPKQTKLLLKFKIFEAYITEIINQYQITHMVIERSYEAMFGSRSSSSTTALLNQANILYQYICYNKGLLVDDISPSEARKAALEGFSFKRKGVIQKQKEQVFFKVLEILSPERFPTKTLQSGSRKGEIVFIDEAMDMADAYVTGKGYYNLHFKNKHESL